MKIAPFLLLLLTVSCAYKKLQSKLIDKGYNVYKDTIIIKPYEYYIKNKGYTIQYQELHPIKALDVRIGIKGYENADTIPGDVLKNNLEFYFSDISIKKIVSGEIYYKTYGMGNISYLKNKNIDSLKLSYGPFMNKLKKLSQTDFIFFWNFNVQKGADTFILPARMYYIKY